MVNKNKGIFIVTVNDETGPNHRFTLLVGGYSILLPPKLEGGLFQMEFVKVFTTSIAFVEFATPLKKTHALCIVLSLKGTLNSTPCFTMEL